jgi:integrase
VHIGPDEKRTNARPLRFEAVFVVRIRAFAVGSILDDLFNSRDGTTAPLATFDQAFESWLAYARKSGQVTRDTSAETYRHLWAVLTKWCIGSKALIHLDAITEGDLEAFIASRHGAVSEGDDLSPRYVWRVLHLVDRVLSHRARLQGRAPNVAASEVLNSRPEWRYANAAVNDGLPDNLPPSRAKQLVAYLSEARPRPDGLQAHLTWNQLRNRAAVGLQLGAGLSPGDVRAALLSGVTVDGARQRGVPWKLRLPADGTAPERETPIASWAGHVLRHWLDIRADFAIAGPYLFPSTRTGKPWGKVAQYQAVKEVLEEAGFPEELVAGG